MLNPVEPFIVLLIAHLIGDFVLQTEQMALKKGSVVRWLLLHSFELGLITWILCWTLDAWPIVLVVFLTHLVFDWTKPRLPGSPLAWYIADQVAHLIVLWGCAGWMATHIRSDSMPLSDVLPYKVQVLIVAYMLIGRPLNVGMALFLKPWQEELSKPNLNDPAAGSVTGLARSSEWIGNLERFFVLTCVLVDQYLLVGGILIAKAIMRFGETSQSGNRKRADYVIIGTLGSVGLAFLIGVLAKQAILAAAF